MKVYIWRPELDGNPKAQGTDYLVEYFDDRVGVNSVSTVEIDWAFHYI